MNAGPGAGHPALRRGGGALGGAAGGPALRVPAHCPAREAASGRPGRGSRRPGARGPHGGLASGGQLPQGTRTARNRSLTEEEPAGPVPLPPRPERHRAGGRDGVPSARHILSPPVIREPRGLFTEGRAGPSSPARRSFPPRGAAPVSAARERGCHLQRPARHPSSPLPPGGPRVPGAPCRAPPPRAGGRPRKSQSADGQVGANSGNLVKLLGFFPPVSGTEQPADLRNLDDDVDTGFGKEAPLITHLVHAWRGWVTVGGCVPDKLGQPRKVEPGDLV